MPDCYKILLGNVVEKLRHWTGMKKRRQSYIHSYWLMSIKKKSPMDIVWSKVLYLNRGQHVQR